MYEKFTDRARKVVQLANQEAQRVNHSEVGVDHLLVALIKEGGGVGFEVLKQLGAADAMLKATRDIMAASEAIVTMGKLPHTAGVKRVLERTIQRAIELKHEYVDTGHVLLALMDDPEGVPCGIANHVGVSPEVIQQAVLKMAESGSFRDFKLANTTTVAAIPIGAISPIILEVASGHWVRWIDGRLEVRQS